MAFSWNPGALSGQGDRKADVPPQASVLTPCPLSALTERVPETPSGEPGAKAARPGASPPLSVSALEGAEPRQAQRFTGGHPRLFAPLLTGSFTGASAPSSAFTGEGGVKELSPGARSTDVTPGNAAITSPPAVSALTERAVPHPAARLRDGATGEREAGALVVPDAVMVDLVRDALSVSALSEAAAPPAGARTGSPAVADRSSLPGNDDNAAAASLSAPPPYPMRRGRALLFGSVRAW